ncbi:MAG: hypothetical protein AAFN16_02210 [Pseudomonadota bacterium]
MITQRLCAPSDLAHSARMKNPLPRPVFVLIVLLASPAQAGDHDRFLGTWGTAEQCARAPIKPGGTVLAEPFEIGRLWMKHGQHWCKLDWGPVETGDEGAFTAATAQCGEDSVRGYFLGLKLAGDALTLRWDFPHFNGPLKRCAGS